MRRTGRDLLAASPVSPWAVAALLLGLVGLGLRLQDFGRYGFWNDEAWVALSTRVAGWSQFWLALGLTPVGWGAALQPFSWLPGRPEVTLRLLPLACSLLTLAAAWTTAAAFAGGAAGALAVAVLAFDPVSVAYAEVLKPYSAEACLALLALLAAIRFAQSQHTRDLIGFALVLALGVPFANSQLFLAPPLLVASLLPPLWRRDWRTAGRVMIAGAIVGAWDFALFLLFIRPRIVSSLVEYWAESYVPTVSLGAAAAFVGRSLVTLLGPAATPMTLVLAAGGVVALVMLVPAARVVALALLLLLIELVALSALRRLPLNEPRVMLFFSTLLLVVTAAGIGFLLLRVATRPRIGAVAAGGFLLLVWHAAARPDVWTSRGRVRVEDLGPLVRLVEEGRAPDDRVLVYARSRYVWAYYQTPAPVLVPNVDTTVGFEPRLPDARVIPVDAATLNQALDRAFAGSGQVWFVGSRFRQGDARTITSRLAARGEVVLTRSRPDGFLMVVRRTSGS